MDEQYKTETAEQTKVLFVHQGTLHSTKNTSWQLSLKTILISHTEACRKLILQMYASKVISLVQATPLFKIKAK